MKAVNRDAISSIAWFFAGRITDGTDGSIQMAAVGTERQSKEIALMGIFAEAVIGKIGELIVFQIQDRNGLVLMTLLRAISVV